MSVIDPPPIGFKGDDMLKKKLKLRLEELRIEQFQIWRESATQQGTVRGLEGGETQDPPVCSIWPINCVDAPITWVNC
jgi:hypothetical protein